MKITLGLKFCTGPRFYSETHGQISLTMTSEEVRTKVLEVYGSVLRLL